MELRHLRYFTAVAEERSFTRAAERLNTVQPSLSRQIKDLEEEIGTPLLVRTSRTVELTRAGELLLEESRAILRHVGLALDRTRAAGRPERRHLKVGFIIGTEIDELSRVIALLQEEEGIEISLRSNTSPLIIEDILAGRLDIGFIRPAPQAAGLRQHVVRRDRLIVALPDGHPLAAQPAIDIHQLQSVPMIDAAAAHAPVLFETIRSYGLLRGVELKPAYTSENLMMAFSLIKSAGGAALLPASAKALFPASIIAVELLGDPPQIELAIAWEPTSHKPDLDNFLRAFGISEAEEA